MPLSISKEISPIDALWALFKSQPKTIRKALTERILMDDVQAEAIRRKLAVKQSLENALRELKEAEKSGIDLPDARHLFR